MPQSVIRRRLMPSKNNIGGPKVRRSGVSLMKGTVEFPIYGYAQGVEKRPNGGTSGTLTFPSVQVLDLHRRPAVLGGGDVPGLRSSPGDFRRRQRAAAVRDCAAGVR